MNAAKMGPRNGRHEPQSSGVDCCRTCPDSMACTAQGFCTKHEAEAIKADLHEDELKNSGEWQRRHWGMR